MGYKTKEAKAAAHKAWREKNAVSLRVKRRAYYEANKPEILAYQKEYKAALPQAVVLERRKRWQAAHRDREKKRYHMTRAWLPWLNALRGSKQRAKREGIPFTIDKAWAVARWTGRCEVTEIEFILSDRRNPYLFSPSIDRIIPANGYTPENSRFVLHAVNALKGAGTDEDMLKIAEAIVRSLKPPKHYVTSAAATENQCITVSPTDAATVAAANQTNEAP